MPQPYTPEQQDIRGRALRFALVSLAVIVMVNAAVDECWHPWGTPLAEAHTALVLAFAPLTVRLITAGVMLRPGTPVTPWIVIFGLMSAMTGLSLVLDLVRVPLLPDGHAGSTWSGLMNALFAVSALIATVVRARRDRHARTTE